MSVLSSCQDKALFSQERGFKLAPSVISSSKFMQSPVRPWYKEPYVWMLIGFPTSSVLICTLLITLAVNNKDSLVRDNYYKDGLAINQELQWDRKAVAMDVRLQLTVTGNMAEIKILNTRNELPSTLTLKLSHPTLVGKDRDALLQLTHDKIYQGFIEEVEETRFYVQIESLEQSWRVRDEIRVHPSHSIDLTAKM